MINNKKEKNICIIQLHSGFLHPILMSLITKLDKDDFNIYVICLKDKNIIYRNPAWKNTFIYRIPGYYGKNIFKFVSSSIKQIFYILKIVTKTRYDFLIGVSIIGLVAASLVGFIFRVKRIYISLELYFSKELKKIPWKIYKFLEKLCNKLTEFTVVQDSWRSRLLIDENKISKSSVIILPNTTIGRAEMKDSSFLHEILRIDLNKKILLHPGHPYLSNILDIFLKHESLLPENWIVVFHIGYKTDVDMRKYKLFNGKKIYFSTKPISYENLGELYASATIGLSLHYNTDRPGGGKNQTYIGYSSGKFNLFLKYGKPVITTNQPTFIQIFKNYCCGVAIKNIFQISNAIENIDEKMNFYRTEAIRFYNDRLDFDNYYENFKNCLT